MPTKSTNSTPTSTATFGLTEAAVTYVILIGSLALLFGAYFWVLDIAF